MDVATLQGRLSRGEPIFVLDIRDDRTRAEWSIPGSQGMDAMASIWRGDFGPLDGVDIPADREVVVVCAVGKTSRLAAEHLRRRGIRADSLEGGMKAWSRAWNEAEAILPDGTTVLQVRRTGRGCLSYVVAQGGRALVVDAVLDGDVYEREAQRRGWRVVGAMDTHLHADHLSRTHRVARHLGVPYHMSGKARLSFDHKPITEGDQVGVGGTAVTVLSTPGHTWDSSAYLLPGGAVLTGDTLFVDGVGRPDLGAGKQEVRERALALHGSLARLTALPAGTRVLPAHASTPLPFDGSPWDATVAQVRERVDLLQMDEASFVEAILARTPDVPEVYHKIVGLNRAGEFPEARLDELEAGANKCAAK